MVYYHKAFLLSIWTFQRHLHLRNVLKRFFFAAFWGLHRSGFRGDSELVELSFLWNNSDVYWLIRAVRLRRWERLMVVVVPGSRASSPATDWSSSNCAFMKTTTCGPLLSAFFREVYRVTTCLENLEMSGNLKRVREMSGILLTVREMSGKKSCHGKVSQNLILCT